MLIWGFKLEGKVKMNKIPYMLESIISLEMKFYEVTGARKAAQINAGFLKEVSSTSSGDTASRRILNTTHIIDPCHLCMQRQANKVNTSHKSLNERSMYQMKN
ncbi:hypothetical protein DPMN_152337 [Dreissena polymorpha]|uniref:Uncharacterized protein n=1 Tax=Dreissena polymorpha TaxID=45954 RepID=A0A9D4FJB4_DREPO|nr:hypothetical protein DPMN_152337 [Dreissena polymorpha]